MAPPSDAADLVASDGEEVDDSDGGGLDSNQWSPARGGAGGGTPTGRSHRRSTILRRSAALADVMAGGDKATAAAMRDLLRPRHPPRQALVLRHVHGYDGRRVAGGGLQLVAPMSAASPRAAVSSGQEAVYVVGCVAVIVDAVRYPAAQSSEPWGAGPPSAPTSPSPSPVGRSSGSAAVTPSASATAASRRMTRGASHVSFSLPSSPRPSIEGVGGDATFSTPGAPVLPPPLTELAVTADNPLFSRVSSNASTPASSDGERASIGSGVFASGSSSGGGSGGAAGKLRPSLAVTIVSSGLGSVLLSPSAAGVAAAAAAAASGPAGRSTAPTRRQRLYTGHDAAITAVVSHPFLPLVATVQLPPPAPAAAPTAAAAAAAAPTPAPGLVHVWDARSMTALCAPLALPAAAAAPTAPAVVVSLAFSSCGRFLAALVDVAHTSPTASAASPPAAVSAAAATRARLAAQGAAAAGVVPPRRTAAAAAAAALRVTQSVVLWDVASLVASDDDATATPSTGGGGVAADRGASAAAAAAVFGVADLLRTPTPQYCTSLEGRTVSGDAARSLAAVGMAPGEGGRNRDEFILTARGGATSAWLLTLRVMPTGAEADEVATVAALVGTRAPLYIRKLVLRPVSLGLAAAPLWNGGAAATAGGGAGTPSLPPPPPTTPLASRAAGRRLPAAAAPPTSPASGRPITATAATATVAAPASVTRALLVDALPVPAAHPPPRAGSPRSVAHAWPAPPPVPSPVPSAIVAGRSDGVVLVHDGASVRLLRPVLSPGTPVAAMCIARPSAPSVAADGSATLVVVVVGADGAVRALSVTRHADGGWVASAPPVAAGTIPAAHLPPAGATAALVPAPPGGDGSDGSHDYNLVALVGTRAGTLHRVTVPWPSSPDPSAAAAAVAKPGARPSLGVQPTLLEAAGGGSCTVLAAHPRLPLAAVGGADGTVALVDLLSRRLLGRITIAKARGAVAETGGESQCGITAADFSSDGEFLVVGFAGMAPVLSSLVLDRLRRGGAGDASPLGSPRDASPRAYRLGGGREAVRRGAPRGASDTASGGLCVLRLNVPMEWLFVTARDNPDCSLVVTALRAYQLAASSGGGGGAGGGGGGAAASAAATAASATAAAAAAAAAGWRPEAPALLPVHFVAQPQRAAGITCLRVAPPAIEAGGATPASSARAVARSHDGLPTPTGSPPGAAGAGRAQAATVDATLTRALGMMKAASARAAAVATPPGSGRKPAAVGSSPVGGAATSGYTIAVGCVDGSVELYSYDPAGPADGALRRRRQLKPGAALGTPPLRCLPPSPSVLRLDWDVTGRYLQGALASYELVHWDASAGAVLRHPAVLRDVSWVTQSCMFGWPVSGVWPTLPLPALHTLFTRRAHKPDTAYLPCDAFTEVACVARNAGGSDVLAAGGTDGRLALYAYPAHAPGAGVRWYAGQAGSVSDLAFSADDAHLLAASSADGSVFQWALIWNDAVTQRVKGRLSRSDVVAATALRTVSCRGAADMLVAAVQARLEVTGGMDAGASVTSPLGRAGSASRPASRLRAAATAAAAAGIAPVATGAAAVEVALRHATPLRTSSTISSRATTSPRPTASVDTTTVAAAAATAATPPAPLPAPPPPPRDLRSPPRPPARAEDGASPVVAAISRLPLPAAAGRGRSDSSDGLPGGKTAAATTAAAAPPGDVSLVRNGSGSWGRLDDDDEEDDSGMMHTVDTHAPAGEQPPQHGGARRRHKEWWPSWWPAGQHQQRRPQQRQQ